MRRISDRTDERESKCAASKDLDCLQSFRSGKRNPTSGIFGDLPHRLYGISPKNSTSIYLRIGAPQMRGVVRSAPCGRREGVNSSLDPRTANDNDNRVSRHLY